MNGISMFLIGLLPCLIAIVILWRIQHRIDPLLHKFLADYKNSLNACEEARGEVVNYEFRIAPPVRLQQLYSQRRLAVGLGLVLIIGHLVFLTETINLIDLYMFGNTARISLGTVFPFLFFASLLTCIAWRFVLSSGCLKEVKRCLSGELQNKRLERRRPIHPNMVNYQT